LRVRDANESYIIGMNLRADEVKHD